MLCAHALLMVKELCTESNSQSPRITYLLHKQSIAIRQGNAVAVLGRQGGVVNWILLGFTACYIFVLFTFLGVNWILFIVVPIYRWDT